MVLSKPPPLSRILETCMMVKSMDVTRDFYTSVFALEPILSTPRITALAMDTARSHVLLLFQLGSTAEDSVDESKPDNVIPGHGPTEPVLKVLLNDAESLDNANWSGLKQHFCFAAKDRDEVLQWEEFLIEKKVPITGRMDWGQRGYSVYFADPENNVGEIASRRLWELL